MLKTRLQVATNVNYDVFRKYVAWMAERGLVELENSLDGHERVMLSRKGQEAYKKLVQWMNDEIHGWNPRDEPQTRRGRT